MQGWVKLHRKIMENPIFLKPELLQLFMYCIFKANYEDTQIIFNDEFVDVKQGQFITGRDVLAKALKQKPITTYKRLKLLEKLEYLNIKSNNRFSIITVVNYGLYQLTKEESNSTFNNYVTTREQLDNTDKKYKNKKNKKNKDIGELSHSLKNKEKEETQFDLYVAEVIDYLNEKTNKKFRHSTKEFRKHIIARFQDNRTIDDFKKVIDIKVSQWLNDPKMDKFLKPDTLFRESNFESYINENPDIPNNPIKQNNISYIPKREVRMG